MLRQPTLRSQLVPVLALLDLANYAGYVSYVHQVRNGLVTYIHSSVQHRHLGSSTDEDATFQLFEVTARVGKIQISNVYCAPGALNVTTLHLLTDTGFIYVGKFNGRHQDLEDYEESKWTFSASVRSS